MAYYYIKSGGTATGDAGRSVTKRTGSFTAMGTSAYYDNIYDVFAGAVPTTPPSGDIVLASSAHDHNYTTTVGCGIYAGTTLYSVDDLNADQYQRGAQETTLGALHGLTLFAGAGCHIEGFSFETSTGTFNPFTPYGHKIVDCILKTGDTTVNSGWNGVNTLINTDIVATDASFTGLNTADGGGVYIMRGGSISDGIGGSVFAAFGGSNDLHIDVQDTYINADALFNGGATTKLIAEVQRCKLAAGMVISNSVTRTCYDFNGVQLQSCDTGDGYHYFKHELEHGTTDEETAVYRTAGATYDGTNHFSAEMIAEATASHSGPLYFDLYNGWIDTADYTTTITAKIHFATNDAAMLVDSSKVWFEFEYADGADNALGVIATNKTDPLVSGVAPTTETSLWTGLDGTDQQLSMTVAATIGVSAGNIASGVVRIRMFLAGSSDTIFVCPQVEFS